MSNYQKQKYYKQKNTTTVPEVILVGLGKAIWWLITLPFHRGKKRQRGISGADQQYINSKKSEINSMLNSDNVYEVRHAVMEADKLVDHILQLKGYQGETFADRLRSAERYMDGNTYQRLWDGHKIRNMLAHDNSNIPESQIREAVNNLMRYTNA